MANSLYRGVGRVATPDLPILTGKSDSIPSCRRNCPVRRRDFIALGGAAIAWPRAAQASEMRRLAVLTTFGDSTQMAGASQGDRARGSTRCHDLQPSDGVICGLLPAPVRGRRPGKRGSSKRHGGPQRCRYRECHRGPRARAGRWLRRAAGRLHWNTSRPDRIACGPLPFARGVSISLVRGNRRPAFIWHRFRRHVPSGGLPTSIAFSKVRGRPIFRCRHQPNTN